MAKAIYFASYYHSNNDDYRNYVSDYYFSGENPVNLFVDEWDRHSESNPEYSPDFADKLKEFNTYKKMCKKGVTGSSAKLKKLLIHKKFFSMPWLLCYDELLKP